MKPKSLGQIAYEANKQLMDYDWENISSGAKRHWNITASAVAREVKRRSKRKR